MLWTEPLVADKLVCMECYATAAVHHAQPAYILRTQIYIVHGEPYRGHRQLEASSGLEMHLIETRKDMCGLSEYPHFPDGLFICLHASSFLILFYCRSNLFLQKLLVLLMVHIFNRLRKNIFNCTTCFDPNGSSSCVFSYT
jgi:hypothetical protein